MRYAKVVVPETKTPAGYAENIRRYLPRAGNYWVASIVLGVPPWILIAGEDQDGWTLDEYVIDRLWTGIIRAREITETEARPALPHATCDRGGSPAPRQQTWQELRTRRNRPS